MRERRKIIELWQRGDAVALATLVGVEGSSYRRPGARLLIAANGDYAGSISGGCLEAEVVRKARWLTRHGAVVERYSTLFDDTAEIPFGLGCGGTVNLLLEPAGTAEFAALMHALEASLHGKACHVETVLPSPGHPLQRFVQPLSSPHRSSPYLGSPYLGSQLEAQGSAPVDRITASSGGGVFTERIEPPQRLFGAGDDAQPLVSMAALLGWNVTVIDGRPQWARPERFPEAEHVLPFDPSHLHRLPDPSNRHVHSEPSKGHGFSRAIPAGDPAGALAPEGALDNLHITQRDAVVVMTHSYEQDRAWLTAMLPLRPRYLGLLGARHRSALLVAEAAAALGWSLERACEGLFAPVGLDLGGDGAEAIALAIIAEMNACVEGKLGVSRRMTAELVEEQIAQGGASRYLQAQCAL
jgi:xanthine dehydrogenase accessory factor